MGISPALPTVVHYIHTLLNGLVTGTKAKGSVLKN